MLHVFTHSGSILAWITWCHCY